MTLFTTASTLRRPIGRRALLRGAGAALALPWLETMALGRGTPEAPVRFVCLYAPNGMLPAAWRPKAEERELVLTPTLASLAPVRESCVVLGNLFNRESRAGEGHYVKLSAFLSGAPVKRTGGRELSVGTSIDQLLAARVGHETPLESLVLGIEPPMNRVDMGYSTVYGANVSWRTPTQPATRELSPRAAFERLVRWSGVRGDAGRKAVLDLVLAEAKGLRQGLGGADGAKLDEYLDAVHTLDQRIEAFESDAASAPPIDAGVEPPESVGDFQEHVQLMLELIALALRTDSTRSATLMFGNAVSGRDFSFLEGVSGGHHHLSHHEDKPEMMTQYALINRWHAGRFAWLMQRLAGIQEGEGSLLDRSIVLFGSGIADGNRHEPDDLPIVVGGGVFRGGRHLRQPRLTPLCNLYVSVLRAFGFADERFGDSTGELDCLVH
jgi:hypothetical protein